MTNILKLQVPPKRGEPGYKDKLHGEEEVCALLFADDLTELTYDPRTAQKIIHKTKYKTKIIDKTCKRFSLYVSFKKSFIQEWPAANDPVQNTPEEALFTVNGNPIVNKTKFKALGQVIDNQDTNGYISSRIAMATGQFRKYQHLLTDGKVIKWARIAYHLCEVHCSMQ